MPFRLIHIVLLFIALQGIGNAWGQEEGLASFYHDRFHGRPSSSGRVHDKDELVAAHRQYPFGTFLRVTNLANMKSAIVCVTDRGPRSKKRLLDVSEEAAKVLDFTEKGVTRVRIEIVPGPLDLRYLDLIYPKLPFLDIDYKAPELPFRFK